MTLRVTHAEKHAAPRKSSALTELLILSQTHPDEPFLEKPQPTDATPVQEQEDKQGVDQISDAPTLLHDSDKKKRQTEDILRTAQKAAASMELPG